MRPGALRRSALMAAVSAAPGLAGGAWPGICFIGRLQGRGRVAMARIVIVGAGVVGLGAGLLLCGDG